MKVMVLVAGLVLAAGGCGAGGGDPAACKAALDESSTGPAVWAVDKSSRPDACQGLSEEAFAKISSEVYEQWQKETGMP